MCIRDRCQFDTLYHEHFSYLSLTAVVRIFASQGLTVFDVQELPTHGGSLRVLARRSDGQAGLAAEPMNPRVAAMLSREDNVGMRSAAFYSDLQRQAIRIKRELLLFLLKAQASGETVAAYGACLLYTSRCV